MMRNIDYNLKLLQDFLSCSYNIYTWRYNASMNLIHTDSPQQNHSIYQILFSLEPGLHFKPLELYPFNQPVIMTNSLGLMWCADFFVQQNQLEEIIIIGPVFYNEISVSTLDYILEQHNLSVSLKHTCLKILKEIPIMQATHFYEYVQLLHLLVTGDKSSPTDFIFQYSKEPTFPYVTDLKQRHHGSQHIEEMVTHLVEEGNINYKEAFGKYSTMVNVGNFGDGTPLRQIKNQDIIMIALITRAAIKGGLLPETAYTLSDIYIQKLESLTDIAEINTLIMTVMDDFTNRVHQIKTETNISKPIRTCLDYIAFHVTEKISVHKLAELVGYTDNYLSQKFKRETGYTISKHILSKKIEYAEKILSIDQLPITTLSEELGFESPSYFCKQFKKITGFTPTAYKEKGLAHETQR